MPERKPRRRSAFSLVACLLLVAFTCAVVYRCSSWGVPPSDADISELFRVNRRHFEELEQMLRADEKVGTIGERFAFARDKPFLHASPEELGISSSRLGTYKSHMDAAGIERVDRLDGGGVLFGIWAWGAIDTFRHKGIAFFPAPPQSDSHRKYRRVDGPWYIFGD